MEQEQKKGLKLNTILLIVVAVLLGVAIFVITKDRSKIAEWENAFPPLDESGVVGDNLNNTKPADSTDILAVKDCDPNESPRIKVLSPNGGETYTAGQQVTVKWTSCNVPNDVEIGIDLKNRATTNTDIVHNLISQTLNTGRVSVVLSPQSGIQGFQFGNKFKIELFYVVKSGGSTENIYPIPIWLNNIDQSDNFFTVNQAPISTNSLLKKDCDPNEAPWIKVLSPNGGEVYTIGQQIMAKWTSCNVQNIYVRLISNNNVLGELTPNGQPISVTQSISVAQGSLQFTAYNPAYGFTQLNTNNYQIAIQSLSPDINVRSGTFSVSGK